MSVMRAWFRWILGEPAGRWPFRKGFQASRVRAHAERAMIHQSGLAPVPTGERPVALRHQMSFGCHPPGTRGRDSDMSGTAARWRTASAAWTSHSGRTWPTGPCLSRAWSDLLMEDQEYHTRGPHPSCRSRREWRHSFRKETPSPTVTDFHSSTPTSMTAMDAVFPSSITPFGSGPPATCLGLSGSVIPSGSG